MQNERAAALIAAIFLILGIVGTNEWNAEQLIAARKDADALRTNLGAIGCEAPATVVYASQVHP